MQEPCGHKPSSYYFTRGLPCDSLGPPSCLRILGSGKYRKRMILYIHRAKGDIVQTAILSMWLFEETALLLCRASNALSGHLIP